jgi:hypothetical protein
LKTSVTRIGSTVLLMPDPPVICFWKWIGWKNYELPKNRNLESVSAKKLILFSLMPNLPACVYPPGPLYSENKSLPSRCFPSPVPLFPVAHPLAMQRTRRSSPWRRACPSSVCSPSTTSSPAPGGRDDTGAWDSRDVLLLLRNMVSQELVVAGSVSPSAIGGQTGRAGMARH